MPTAANFPFKQKLAAVIRLFPMKRGIKQGVNGVTIEYFSVEICDMLNN